MGMHQSHNKNILIVGSYPPPFGGVSSQIENTARDLATDGWKVFIVSPDRRTEFSNKGPLSVYRIDLKISFYKLLQPSKIRKNISSLFKMKDYGLNLKESLREVVLSNYVADVISENKISIAHFYTLVNAFTIPLLHGMLGIRIPFVLTLYLDINERLDFFRPKARLIADMLAGADRVISSSRYAARSVEKINLSSARIEPVYYGVDLDVFSPAAEKGNVRKELGIGPTAKFMLFVGRLKKEMGLDAVLDAFERIFGQRDDCALAIIGASGEMEDDTKVFCGRYAGKAFLKTNLPAAQLPLYYADCDALLAPTNAHHAAMGMSIKEAMACGRPVIATDAPGIAEAVVNGRTGILVPSSDDGRINTEVFYREIVGYLDHPEEMKEAGIRARKRAEELFDKNLTFRKILGIYESIFNERLSPFGG